MRGRPEVKLRFDPAAAVAGEVLTTQTLLVSHAETPVDGVTIALTGLAWAGVQQSEILRLVDRHPRTTLDRGKRQLVSRFLLPSGLPPTYRGAYGHVRYQIAVHVRIPWWLDRRAVFDLSIAAGPRTPPSPEPRTYASHPNGPIGDAPYIEAALEATAIVAGEVLAGVVSVSNTRAVRVRNVRAAMVAYELLATGVRNATYRVDCLFVDGHPPEGEPLPFRVRTPARLVPSMRTLPFRIAWQLDITVELALRRDAVLSIPVDVVPAVRAGGTARARTATARASRMAPVGRERRALLWAQVADACGMVNDAAEEQMSLAVGDTTLVVGLEQRRKDGIWSRATIAWPGLGMDLRVWERPFLHVGGRLVELEDPRARRRLAVRAREPAQAKACLDVELVGALLRFREVSMHDEGAELASPGGLRSREKLEAFVRDAQWAARQLARATAGVPAPAKMSAFEDAWRTFAARVGGRLVKGSMCIHHATWGVDTFELGTEWRGEEPHATRIAITLDPPVEAARGGVLDAPSLTRAARELADAIAGQVMSLRIEADEIEVEIPAPLEDPATVEPTIELMAKLARSLRGIAGGGPFR